MHGVGAIGERHGGEQGYKQCQCHGHVHHHACKDEDDIHQQQEANWTQAHLLNQSGYCLRDALQRCQVTEGCDRAKDHENRTRQDRGPGKAFPNIRRG